MKKILTLILVGLPALVLAANESATVESAPIDPCTAVKKQVSANFNQIQSYKAAGQDGKIPALHQANVALRKANPNCFAQ